MQDVDCTPSNRTELAVWLRNAFQTFTKGGGAAFDF